MGMGGVDAFEFKQRLDPQAPTRPTNVFRLYLKWLDSYTLANEIICCVVLKQATGLNVERETEVEQDWGRTDHLGICSIALKKKFCSEIMTMS